MNSSEKMGYHAGEAKGQAKEKTSNVVDSACNKAQSAKDSMQEAGQQMKAKAGGAADDVKNATGIGK
ncbi:hypothetical protein TIFTF001_051072 [Ficus carica]|uniref:Stress-induced protein KIN2-like n=1 Tax=Ficus carica TaxID=3494 RepID=A0AA87YWV4_FICCA|nr:hypothetical protein TIFTF001_051072 [Ficus carica]